MGNTRTHFPDLPLIRRAGLLPIALLLAGCATIPASVIDRPGETIPAVATALPEPSAQDAPLSANGTEKLIYKPGKPPAPRTVWQALHAYLRRVCSGEYCCENPPLALADNVAGEGESDKACAPQKPYTLSQADDRKDENGKDKAKNGDKEKNGKDKEPDKNGEDDKNKDKEEDKCKLLPEGWNFHAQTTIIPNFQPGFGAQYSGPNSLGTVRDRRGTISADLFLGVPLWHGAEFHVDLLLWQGFGLSNSFGLEAFPDADAYKAGTVDPRFMLSHFFVRQTFGLGGEQEDVPDGPFTLPGKRDVSRLTITVGRLNMAELFDNNTYNHDPHTQFMSWASTMLT
jgi:hypothetical protein